MRPPRARDGVLTPQVVFCARDREHQRRTEGEGRDEASAPSKAAMDGQCTHSCAILSEGESMRSCKTFGAANERTRRTGA